MQSLLFLCVLVGIALGVPPEGGAASPALAQVSLAAICDDDNGGLGAVPLCHKVTSPTVLNCANSSSMCVTAITPNAKCKLKIDGSACKCE